MEYGDLVCARCTKVPFIAWLTIRGMLATGARMASWGVTQGCMFCGEPSETRDHLFFACPYTFTVWLAVVGDLLETDADPDWDATLARLMEHKYDRLTFILLRLVFQTSIYYLWRERGMKGGTKGRQSQLLRWLLSLIKQFGAESCLRDIMKPPSFKGYFRDGLGVTS